MKKAAAKKTEKKIAILGTTPSRMQAPIEDKSWQIWTIGPGGKDTHRWDRLFEMHTTWPEDFKGYLDDLSKVELPQEVITLDSMSNLIVKWAKEHGKDETVLAKDITGKFVSNKVFPKEAIFEKYGRRMWFSSSIAYLIPLAIEEGATDIGLWGIDLESGEEYISQFVGCAHFIDLAILAGVNVHLPNGSGLTRDPNPYPDRYETHLALTLEKKFKWLQANLDNAEPQLRTLQAEAHRREGAILALNGMENVQEKRTEIEQELIKINSELSQLAANVSHLHGEISATQYYRRMYVWGMLEPDA